MKEDKLKTTGDTDGTWKIPGETVLCCCTHEQCLTLDWKKPCILPFPFGQEKAWDVAGG